ncbi:MAG: DUF4097 family beta strand repeat protein [Acidobacteria bacterium]|nr:DUF4097 family beta strand repeat protein [Acidobacteriota bacterium]
MASPTGSQPVMPPPAAPVPPYRHRSLAGPVILILVGVLFLLANSRVIGWSHLWFWYGRWWPVLIILWGVIKLVEYYRAREGGYRMRGVGLGGAFLLFWLVVLGFAARHSENVNWSDVGPQWDFDLGGNGYDFTDEPAPQPVAPNGTVQVVSDSGDIVISTWDEPRIKVVGHKRVTANDQNEANSMADRTRPVISGSPDSLTVNANTEGSGTRSGVMGAHGVTSNLEIFLPKNASVDLSSRHGDVKVRTRAGSVRISSSHGNIDVEDVTANSSITSRHGDLRAHNITGNLEIDGNIGDLDISNVTGSARVSAEVTGNIKVASVKKGFQFHSSRTDLAIERLGGELNMESGDLRVGQCDGLQLTTRSKDIHLDDVTGDVRVENTNGEVDVHESQLPVGNIRVDNRSGDIEVVLPGGASFEATASSRRGQVESDFAGVHVNPEHGGNIGGGTVGKGGPKLELTSENGNVQIRKAG